MQKRTAVIALFALTASVACGVPADTPPQIQIDRTACSHCGMLVSEEVYAAAYSAPGAEPRVFDDIGCLLEAMASDGRAAGTRFWFHDAESRKWINGETAAFVRSSRLRTPMGGGLVAYRDAARAARAAAHEGVVIRSLQDLLAPPKGGGS